MQLSSVKRYILIALIYSFGVQEVFSLPLVEHRLQITEFFTLALLVIALVDYRKNREYLRILCRANAVFCKAAFALLLTFTASSLIHLSVHSFLDILTKWYLAVYFVVLICTIYSLPQTFVHVVLRHLCIMASTMAVVGLAGWGLSMGGTPNLQVSIFENYPYFGTVHRLKGFTSTPSMFIAIASVGFFAALYHVAIRSQKTSYLIMGLIVLCASLCAFTKSWIYMLAFACAYTIFSRQKKLSVPIALICLTGTAHFCMTHFLVLPQEYKRDTVFLASPYTNNRIAAEAMGAVIFETCYISSKRAAIRLGLRQPLLGIGPGNFRHALDGLKKEGVYPGKLPNFDPHCTVLRSFAEAGIPAALLTIAISVCLILMTLQVYACDKNLGTWMLLTVSVFLWESISTDVLHFRHYWFVYAIIFATAAKAKFKHLFSQVAQS